MEDSRYPWANLAQKCIENLLTGRVDRALTGYVGVELGCEFVTCSSMGIHKCLGIFVFHPDHLQHIQPRRNYQNVNSW